MSQDEAFVLDMILAARNALTFAEGLDSDTWRQDEMRQSAVLHQLVILGEAAKRVSREFQEKHSSVPWSDVAKMRDVYVHQYHRVDVLEVWKVIGEDLPALIPLLEAAVPERPREDG